jgi:hypothetical protein
MMGSLDSKGLELCWSSSWSEKGLELSLAVSGVYGPRHVLEFFLECSGPAAIGLRKQSCNIFPEDLKA